MKKGQISNMDEQDFDLISMAKIIYKGRYVLFASVILVPVLVLIYFGLRPPTYEIKAVVEIPKLPLFEFAADSFKEGSVSPNGHFLFYEFKTTRDVRGLVVNFYAPITRPQSDYLPHSDALKVEETYRSNSIVVIKLSVSEPGRALGVKWMQRISERMNADWQSRFEKLRNIYEGRIQAIKEEEKRLGQLYAILSKERSARTDFLARSEIDTQRNRVLAQLQNGRKEIQGAQLSMALLVDKIVLSEPAVKDTTFSPVILGAVSILAGMIIGLALLLPWSFWLLNRDEIKGGSN